MPSPLKKIRILLADEVSQGVSPLMTQQLWEIFRKVSLDQTSVIMVEQNVAAALDAPPSTPRGEDWDNWALPFPEFHPDPSWPDPRDRPEPVPNYDACP